MIKIKNITKKAGFTKEQQADIAEQVIKVLNNKKSLDKVENVLFSEFHGDFKAFERKVLKSGIYEAKMDGQYSRYDNEIIITVKNTRCKYILNNSFEILFNFLKKIGIDFTSDITVKNRIYEQLRNSEGVVIECPDAYSDGNVAINKKFIGEVPTEETQKNNTTLRQLTPTNLIKLEGYTIAKNQKSNKIKGDKFTIFYKNKKDDFIIFNQKYINMLPKDCDIYFQDNKNRKYSMLVAKKEEKVIALIMPIHRDNLNEFELLPEIIEQNIVKYPIVVYQENKMPIKTLKKEELQEFILNGVMSSDDYIKELEQITVEHKNAVTGHIYKGLNAEALTQALKNNNYQLAEWVASGQAKKLNKQIKKDAKGVTIRIYYEDDSGRSFCKLETIYNVAELENIQKIETTTDYKNMIERLKRA